MRGGRRICQFELSPFLDRLESTCVNNNKSGTGLGCGWAEMWLKAEVVRVCDGGMRSNNNLFLSLLFCVLLVTCFPY